ncbi:type II secretion system F family protein [Tepidibacillus infernus]|uniref:Type II secretion system protein GspF domain-containing protein n=1 Tax=Tepidibacillus decaturensis TaxID=1413211 RepID=A0A135L644_9BACI|nr:type II secretion system F family protein [Tepidibacillus decaturensis]KXG44485.1 hypothetical protein U473_11020 [Tepidibacillus decaturensis]
MKWLVLLVTFLFNFIFILWLSRYLEMRRNRIRKRVLEIESNEWHEEVVDLHKNKKEDSRFALYSFIWKGLSRVKWIQVLDQRIQLELKKANIMMKSSEFMIFVLISTLVGAFLGVFLADGNIERGLWLGLLSWYVPFIWLKAKKRKRKAALESQLPDMISMTANSLKAGYSLIQSLELLSREMAAPLSEEIQRMLQEMRLGVSTEQALTHFNQRVESKDLDLIITAMLIQRQVGGNLAEILDTIGETIRERIRIKGEIKSLTAQGKMSMMIFMILPIGLGVFLLMTNPEYMSVLFTNPIGWAMLGAAILGQLIGAILIKKIINIEV